MNTGSGRLVLAVACLGGWAAAGLHAADGTWTGAVNGVWSNTSSWQGGTVASGAGSAATFANQAGPVLISNDVASLKLQGLVFQGGAYTVYGQPLTFEGATAVPHGVCVSGGTHTVGSALNVNRSIQFMTEPGATVTTTGRLDYLGGYTVTKRGGGEWAFAGTCFETNSAYYLDVVGGTFRLKPGAYFNKVGGTRENFRVGYGVNLPGTAVVDHATMIIDGFVLGYNTGSPGLLAIDGGTFAANTMDEGNPVLVGRDALGVFAVSNGATASIANWFDVGVYSRGEVTVDGASALTVGKLSLGWKDAVAAHNGPGIVEVASGRLTVNTEMVWGASTVAARTNRITVGKGQAGAAVLSLPATMEAVGNAAWSRLTLDGGTLEFSGVRNTSFGESATNYLKGLDQLWIGHAGATLNTGTNTLALLQPVSRDPAMRSDGGLTKMGSGRLTLAGGCAYSGPTVVAQGTLRLGGAMPTNTVIVQAGATLSLADGQFRAFAPSSLSLGQGGASGLELEAGAGGLSDALTLPSGASVGDVSVSLVASNGVSSYWLPGDYVVATYAGSAPDLGSWSTLAPTGVSATFELQPALKRVVLHVSGAPTAASVWLKAGSGAWADAANWNSAPLSAPATAVLFGSAPGAAASVSVGSAVTVGSMTFDAADAYGLSGAGITFGAAGAGGTLSVARGAHTIAQSVTLPEDLAVAVQPGAALLLGGGATGSGRLTASGGGTLAVSNGASLNVPLTVDGATLGALTTSTLGVTLTAGAGGATLIPAAGTTLTLSGALDGAGAVTKRGASIAVLSGPNSATGLRTVRNGTLTLSSLTDGGDLVIGEGTLKYVGPNVTTPKGFTIQTSDAKLGAAFESDADVTFNGTISTVNGVFQKYGKGTLTFAGVGTNTIGVGQGSDNYSAALNRGAFGDSPTQGLRIFMVLDGKVVLGAPGQTNIINNTVVVGGRTTASGTETAGHLEINDGFLQCGIITLGRGNGSAVTAPTGLVSTVRINGGVVQSSGLYAGLQLSDMGSSPCNARPVFEMNGGVHIGTQLWLGNAAAPVQPKLYINGGFTAFTGAGSGDVRLAYDGGVTSLTVVAGGTLAISNVAIRIADSSAAAKGVLRLNGGRLITRGFERLGSGVGELYLNGGLMTLCQSFALTNLTTAVVQAGGLVAEVPQGMTLTLNQTLAHDAALGATPDGGLVKLGAGALVMNQDQNYTGPTIISGGVLRVRGSLAVTNLTLSCGTTLSLTNGAFQVFAPAAFVAGDAGGAARVEMDVAADGSAFDVLALPGGVAGKLTLCLFKSGSSARFVSPGRYPLVTFSGAAPLVDDWSVEGMAGTAAFETDGTTVYVRIGTASGPSAGSVWTNALGGAWSEAGNWSVAPAADASASVLFGGAISAPATVTTGSGATLGYMAVDSANAYTWSGGALTLGSAASNGAVRVTQGSHTVDAGLALPSSASLQVDGGAALQVNGAVTGTGSLQVTGGGTVALTNGASVAVPVTVSGATLAMPQSTAYGAAFTLGAGGATFAPAAGRTVTLSSSVDGSGGLTKTGSSILTLAGGAAFGGELVVRNGTVSLASEPSGTLVIGEGTLSYTGPDAVFARGYRLRTSASTQAATLTSDADLTFNGPVTAELGCFNKLGAGTLTYAYAGENILSAGDNSANGGTYLNVQPYGDTPTQGYRSYNVFNGKVVLGAAGQTNRFSQAVLIGGQSTTNAGAETAAQMEINGGVNIFQDYITVGRGNGTAVTAPAGIESTLTVNNGESTATGFWMAAMLSNQTTLTARPRFVLNGGTLSTLNFYCGNVGGSARPRIEINGGTLTVGPNDVMRLVGAPGCQTEMAINGGTVVVSNQTLNVADNHAGGRGVLALNGGRLVANNLVQNGTNATAVVTFNGGVFEPRASGALSAPLALTNSAGGAIFDVPQGITYTLGTTLNHDAALGASPDGGLVKLGAGTLVVTNAQAYTGPTALSNGTLSVVAPAGAALATGDLVLGRAEGPEVGLMLTADRARLTSDGGLAVNGNLFLGQTAVTLIVRETGMVPSTNGVYVVATCTGAVSGSAGNLRLANPIFGKVYTFGVVGSELRLTVSTEAVNAAVWTAPGGGEWSASGNWMTAPGAGAPGVQVGFLDAITGAATVTLDAAATAGAVRFNNVNSYTLAGAGSLVLDETNGVPQLVAEQGLHTVAVPAALSEPATVAVSNAAELWLTGQVSGAAKLTKVGEGRLLLAGTNLFDGGTEVLQGYLDVAGTAAAGTGSLTFNGGHLASKGAAGAAVANSATVQQPMQVVTYSPLTLAGSWTATGNIYLAKMSTNELTVSGTLKPAAGSANRLDLREGSVRFAAGADALFTSTATRECIDFRAPASTSVRRALTVEPGANVTAKMLYVGYGATNTVTVNGGTLSLTGFQGTYLDAFIMGAAGTSPKVVDRFFVNGGSVVGGDNAWFLMGVDKGRTLLDIAGGTVSLGAVSMGHRTENNIDSGLTAGSDVVVGGGLLEARQRWNWMGDTQGPRVNAVSLNGGRLRLPATFAGVTNKINQTRLIFNGGTLETPGGGTDAEDPGDYLKGLKQAYVAQGGARIDTLGRSVGLSQRLMTLDGATDGGVAKLGLGTLSLAKPPCVTGLVDVQCGTLRMQAEPATAYPDDPMLRLSFESAIQKDESPYGRAVGVVGSVSNLVLTAGVNGTNALRMGGQNVLYADYSGDMANADAFTVSAWVRQSAYQSVTQNKTFFGTLLGGNKPHEFLLRIENGTFRMLGTGAANYAYGSFTADVANALPLNTWAMLTFVVDGANGFSMYVNGERREMKVLVNGTNAFTTVYGAGSTWLFQPPLRTSGRAFVVGAVAEYDTSGFIGDLDDVTVYRRALSPVEIAMLVQAKNPCNKRLRVATAAMADLAGGDHAFAELSGEGTVNNGSAAVWGALNPGDSAGSAAGALLSVANLTLSSNVTYRCDWTPDRNDLVDVWGTLKVEGPGTIDLGLTEPSQMPGFPRRKTFPVMFYSDLVGGSNLSQWQVTGVGRFATATVSAAAGVVTVSLDVPSGTLILMR